LRPAAGRYKGQILAVQAGIGKLCCLSASQVETVIKALGHTGKPDHYYLIIKINKL